MIKYFSAFSWIWAFEYSIKKLKLNRKCVWFSEIDKRAIKTYLHHYPKHKNYWNITNINLAKLGEFDLLFFWLPCQSFSLAWKKKWLQDKRGNLFFNVINILKKKRPKYFIFENVRWILTNNNWKTFETIKKEFDLVWYNIKWKVLNSKDYWLAQNRSRIFIFWERKDLWPFSFEFNEEKKKKVNLIDILQAKVDDKYKVTSKQIINWYNSNYHSNKSQLLNKYCCCLTIWGNKKWIITNKSDEFIKKYYKKELKESELKGIEWRRLTNEEYELLQGYDIWYTLGTSMTSRYNLLGNSISINVIDEILIQFNWYINQKVN